MTSTKKIDRDYYPSGNLRFEAEMTPDGIPDGFNRLYFENGKIECETFTIKGVFHGIWRQWNKNGALLGEYEFDHGTGTLTRWYDSGERQYELELRNGLQHGRERLFDLNGKIVIQKYYLNNKRVSKKKFDLGL